MSGTAVPRPFFDPHWFELLTIGRQARDTVVRITSGTPDAAPGEALVAVIMSAIALEAFINDLARAAEFAVWEEEQFGSPLAPDMEPLRDLGDTLHEVESSRGTTELKFQIAAKVLSGRTFGRGKQPYQDFAGLIGLRNDIVHLGPRGGDSLAEGNLIVPRSRVVRNLQQKGLTRTPGRKPGDVPGGTPWLSELTTPGVARWAYASATNMMREVCEMLPQLPPGRAMSIAHFKVLAAQF